MRSYINLSSFILLSSLLTCCYHTGEFLYHDSGIKMHEYEMVAKLKNANGKKIKNNKSNKITISDNIYLPEEPNAIEDKIVSINVTEETPIVQVINELARMSGTDIQIDPSIIGGVNLNLRDKPLRYVFNRICGLTDVRYKEKYGIVVFERDIPYAKTYSLDFLDISRNSSSSMSLNTSGLTTGSSEVSNQVSGTGTSSVDSSSSDTFWEDIVEDVKQIIKITEETHKVYTKTALTIQNNATENIKRQQMLDKQMNGENTNYVDDTSASISSNFADDSTSNIGSDSEIRVNKRAGIITIVAGEKAHRKIQDYFDKLKKKASAQVLIEMRFLEISLDKKYEAGIDWGNINIANVLNIAQTPITASNTYATLVLNKGIDATAHLFESFGSTRTLSNPRINAMNNQPALMSFATNNVYFKVTAENTTLTSAAGTSQNVTNINAEAQTMPIGVIMSVLPSINIDNGTVTLNLRPTISKTESSAQDPTTYSYIDSAGDVHTEKVDNQIPIANVRELDTILKLKDGQTAVIGGFTERRQEDSSSGVPFIRGIPILGNFFSSKKEHATTVETIILVKATIINHGAKMSDYEEDVYSSFSDDPRLNELYE